MSKLTSILLVAIGGVLAITGLDATASFTSALSHFFTSWPVDKAIWMMIVGVAAIVFGVVGAWRARERLE
jgi:predicted lysophospholipase L1 biosynthesis ABC-type transport system permease subunit